MSGNWKVYVPLEVRQYSDLSRQLKSNKMVQHTDRQDRADYFWYETRSQLSLSQKIETQTINTMLWLFNVLYQITVLPHFKRHVNSSSFLYLLEAWNKHEWTSQHILFKPRKDVNTHHFSSLSLFYCPVWFGCWTRWWIQHYDWSDRLSIKLFAKGQLCWFLLFIFNLATHVSVWSEEEGVGETTSSNIWKLDCGS